jgi:hypothetical protein
MQGRQSRNGLRLDALQPGDASQKILLERDGYELFNLGCREPERFRLDIDGDGLKLGKDIDRSGSQQEDAGNNDHASESSHESAPP